MTNERKVLELFSNLAIFFKFRIYENDAEKFKEAFEAIDVTAIDPKYKSPLTQKFPVEFDSFIKATYDNLSRHTINFSFIENYSNDIGILLHYSDAQDGPFDENTDSLYQIDKAKLIAADHSTYTTQTEQFKNQLGEYIARQTKFPLTEIVSFEMKDVITYLFINLYELQNIPHFKAVKEIEFEMLQYTEDTIMDYPDDFKENKGRISIGARMSFSYLENGTIVTGKLPLYDIGTLHP